MLYSKKGEKQVEKSRETYIENLSIGNIVAFKSKEMMFSGKVVDISDKVTIQTLNNSVFYVDKQDIVWVKLGTNWPTGIYNALRYSRSKK